ncbi:LysM peptidoglycan-binding domain-containing protein [Hymenobacter sp. BT507]|uniref:LysM peptidoglycan-binding domain-containing protein n=1 Tax=Hymenobacter citatus TaxID=2763506 RepID=A0ABR7MIR3_9BACT|nr:LysM peptidoglycan-binding domain-containing protein [Hymenobacter citatus]MBC6610453.1 LysM peptidoglycan-binding domain-containing protein [Hymenobacter citatus]
MPITATYEIKPGDTLAKVAAKYKLTLSTLLAANPQITNPNVVVVGQLLVIPSRVPDPAPTLTNYDGLTPAPGTIEINAAKLIHPPLTNEEAARTATVYTEVIDQFAVGKNPRYRPRDGNTYCNIFLWDVTRAMHCEIPHWVNAQGNPAEPFQAGASEMNVNGTLTWLTNQGTRHFGWKPTDAADAQRCANEGHPAVALWRNPTGGHGHTAVVRPGALLAGRGAAIAQAGRLCFNLGHIKDGFGNLTPKFYVHG